MNLIKPHLHTKRHLMTCLHITVILHIASCHPHCLVSSIARIVLPKLTKVLTRTGTVHSDDGSARMPIILTAHFPHELLDQIFGECRLPSTDQQESQYAWLAVAQVCKRWRTLVLSNPLLWDHLVLLNPQWTKVCLERSQRVPLHVIYRSSRNMYQPFNDPAVAARRLESLHIALQELPRIKGLEVGLGDTVEAYDALVSVKDIPRPLLRSVAFTDPEQAIYMSGAYVDVSDAAKIVVEHATNLMRLSVSGPVCMVPQIPSTLKHLDISNFFPNSPQDGSLKILLDALSCTPLLETFRAGHSSVLMTSSTDVPCRNVSLPNLHSLEFRADLVDIARFLTHISFPSTTHISIESYSLRPSAPAFLARALSTWLNNPSNPSQKSHLKTFTIHLEYNLDTSITFTFLAWKSTKELPDLVEVAGSVSWFRKSRDLSADLKIQFTVSVYARRHLDRAMSAFLRNLAVPEVQTAYIDTMDLQEYRSVLLRSLRPLENLRAICICGRAGRATPVLFQKEPSLCPLLETLRLDDVRMLKPNATPAKFTSALKKRSDDGSRLTKLELLGCTNVKEKDVKALRKWVDEVEWDEEETSDSASEGDSFDEEDDEYEDDSEEDDWWNKDIDEESG